MKKKTKKAIGIGAASAAAFAAGMLLYATPAYADEACSCEPGNHTQDCTCGCADAAKVLEDAERNKQAAQTEADSAEGAEKIAKDAAEDASAAAKTAETAMNNAENAYNDALATEEAAIKADQEKKAEAETAASDALNQAVVKEGQAEIAADEAKTASDAAKEELDTSIGYRDGTLPIEDTEEYKAAQEKQAALDTAKADRDEAGDTLDAAKADAAEKTTALDAATKDNDEKQQTLNDKQTKSDDAKKAADDAKAEHDADVNALNTATQEKEAADKDVVDKTAEKDAADKDKETANNTYDSAVTKESETKAEEEKTHKELEDYKKVVDESKNAKKFLSWLSEESNMSANLKEDAAIALRLMNGNLTDADKAKVLNDGSTYAEGVTPMDYLDVLAGGDSGKANSADHLNQIKTALDLIDIGNGRRAQEPTSNFPLKVLPSLMAMAEVNADYIANGDFRHTLSFAPLENIAWGYSDPYDGWYDKEKAIYDTGSRNGTGHYETLTGKRGDFTVTGFGRNTSGNYDSQFFGYGEGLTTDEFRTIIDDYERPFTDKLNELQIQYDKAKTDHETASAKLASALSAKEAADKAAQDAATALTSAQNNQAEKAKALEDATAKEKASKDALTAADAALAIAEQELTDAKAAADTAANALETATKANADAQATLDAAQKDYDTKQAAYENALAEDEAADKALAELSNVAPRQEAYDKALALAGDAAKALEQAKADTEAAQTVYDEAKRALEVANMRVASDAEAVKSAYEAFQSAKKDYEEKSELAASKQALYEDSKEDTLKAQEALKAAEDRLAAAKLALEAAEKECESHMAKDVTVSINFRTQDGELANVVHTEIYIDGKYTENGAFGLPATLVNTDTVIRINFIAQTGGLDEYTLASAGDENSPEGYFLKFIKTTEEGSDKEIVKAVLTDTNGKVLSGNWFRINGADLQTGNVELVFLMEKKNGNTEPVEPNPTQPTYPDVQVIKNVTGSSSKRAATGSSVVSANVTGTGAKTITAANTGDSSYAQIAAYTVLAAAAIAGMGIAAKRRKRSE